MQTKYMSHSRTPPLIMKRQPPLMMVPGINNLTPSLQQIGVEPGSRLPNYIPQYDDSMMLGVGGLGAMPDVNFHRLDEAQHGFNSTSADFLACPPGASEPQRLRQYHHEQEGSLVTPAQVSHAQASMHNVRSIMGPGSSWVKQSRFGDGAHHEAAAAAGALEQSTPMGGCVMSLTGELSCQTSIDIPRSMRSTQGCHSVCRDQLYWDAGVCTVENDVKPVMNNEKLKKRMLSNRASAQRSRLRRQERLDQLEVLTAQLRVENATLSRKAKLSTEVAIKLEEDNKQLLEKLRKLRQVLDQVGGSKLWKPFMYIFDTDDCTSSQQTSVNHMIGGRASTSPSRKKEATQDDEVSSPCGSAYQGDSNQMGNNDFGEGRRRRRQEEEEEDVSSDKSESDHKYSHHHHHHYHHQEFNVQPSTTTTTTTTGNLLSQEQQLDINDHVTDISGNKSGTSKSRKREFSTGQMTRTSDLEIPPQPMILSSTQVSDCHNLELTRGESCHEQHMMFSSFEIQLPQMLLLPNDDQFQSTSSHHIPTSECVRSLGTVFATTEEEDITWLESFADSLQ